MLDEDEGVGGTEVVQVPRTEPEDVTLVESIARLRSIVSPLREISDPLAVLDEIRHGPSDSTNEVQAAKDALTEREMPGE